MTNDIKGEKPEAAVSRIAYDLSLSPEKNARLRRQETARRVQRLRPIRCRALCSEELERHHPAAVDETTVRDEQRGRGGQRREERGAPVVERVVQSRHFARHVLRRPLEEAHCLQSSLPGATLPRQLSRRWRAPSRIVFGRSLTPQMATEDTSGPRLGSLQSRAPTRRGSGAATRRTRDFCLGARRTTSRATRTFRVARLAARRPGAPLRAAPARASLTARPLSPSSSTRAPTRSPHRCVLRQH